jgi:hypothetical protein
MEIIIAKINLHSSILLIKLINMTGDIHFRPGASGTYRFGAEFSNFGKM